MKAKEFVAWIKAEQMPSRIYCVDQVASSWTFTRTHAELIHIALLGGRAFKLSLVFSIDAYLMIVAITTTLSFDATAKRVWDLLTLRGNSACAGESRDECECQPNLCTCLLYTSRCV